MVQPNISLVRTVPFIGGVGLLISGSGLFLGAMAPRLLAEAQFGPICAGHGSLLAAHCPACYAAAALAILGVALLSGRASAARI